MAVGRPGWERGRSRGAAARRGRCPRGARLSLEKAGGKSTRGRSPLDPRSGEEVPPLRTPSLVFSGLGGGSSFPLTGLRPAQRKAPRRAAHHLGGWGTLLFSLWGGRKRRDRNEKKKNSGKANMKADMLIAHLPLCAHVRPQRVRTIGASRPIGGRLALGAWRCVGRRPLTPIEPLPFPGFHNPEKGSVRGGTSSPHPRGPGAAAPGALCPAFSRESRNPPREWPPGGRPPSTSPPGPAGSSGGKLSPPLWETPEKGRELFFPASPNFDGKYGGFR